MFIRNDLWSFVNPLRMRIEIIYNTLTTLGCGKPKYREKEKEKEN